MHNDKLETFFNDPVEQHSPKEDVDFLASLISPMAAEPQDQPASLFSGNGSSDFFDNDSFWSGSLTWY
jgi:hypothetical protein